MVKISEPHLKATRADLKLRLVQDQHIHLQTSAHRALFEKSLSLYRAYCTHGCLGPADASTNSEHAVEDNQWILQKKRAQRGHDSKPKCDGKLIFDHDLNGKAFVRSVHHVLLLLHTAD
jgi:hypothetical protein